MHQWSTTPLNNQTADSRANWQEGQPASSLNNSARGMMATAAFWRDDNLGATLTATAGSSNVYTVTTGQGLIDPTTVSGTPAITHAFSLRVAFSAAPTGMATNPLKLAIDGAAAATVTRADGSALVDGDIATGKSYPIVGYAFTSGALSQIRVLSILPSEVNALADARINAALPSITASIGNPVQKAGDTMTGTLRLDYGVLQIGKYGQPSANASNTWQFVGGADGRLYVQKADGSGSFLFGSDGTFSIPQFGDLNSRIESRAEAWATQQANGIYNQVVTSARWVYAGDKTCISQPGTGGFISPFGGQAMNCEFWSWSFTTADGQSGAAPYAYRYRNLQIYIPNQGWVTVGAVS